MINMNCKKRRKFEITVARSFQFNKNTIGNERKAG